MRAHRPLEGRPIHDVHTEATLGADRRCCATDWPALIPIPPAAAWTHHRMVWCAPMVLIARWRPCEGVARGAIRPLWVKPLRHVNLDLHRAIALEDGVSEAAAAGKAAHGGRPDTGRPSWSWLSSSPRSGG